MAKKNQEAEIPQKEISQQQIDSSKRMQVLSKHISQAIKTAHEEIDGDFTLLEVIHVMNQNANAYCRNGLKQEWT